VRYVTKYLRTPDIWRNDAKTAKDKIAKKKRDGNNWADGVDYSPSFNKKKPLGGVFFFHNIFKNSIYYHLASNLLQRDISLNKLKS